MEYTMIDLSVQNNVETILAKAREAEVARDFVAFRDVIGTIWSDLNSEPLVDSFKKPQQAEILRLCGFFLSYYGKVKNLPRYQERAKNNLTRSIDIYNELGQKLDAAEASIMLANCYFNEGAVNECESILDNTKSEFESNKLHKIYLQACINRVISMISKKEYQEALEILKEIEIPMEFCDDNKLRSLYNEKLGLVYKNTDKFEEAVFHYKQAIDIARNSGNFLFMSLNINNLANLYNKKGDYAAAHYVVDQALEVADENKLIGWIANFLDTKAMILSGEGKLQLALATIEKSIEIFKKGEDSGGLAEAIWNKCKFLLQLNRKEEAILLFTELIPLATIQIGEFAVKNFVKEFSSLIYVRQNCSLDEEIKRFQFSELSSALNTAHFNLVEAAKILLIKPPDLRKLIETDHPELLAQIEIQSDTSLSVTLDRSEVTKTISSPRDISQLNLSETETTFEGSKYFDFSTYFVSSEVAQKTFGLGFDLVVAVSPNQAASPGSFILVKDLDSLNYRINKPNEIDTPEVSFSDDERKKISVSTSIHKIIGEVVGYCGFDELDKESITFKEFGS